MEIWEIFLIMLLASLIDPFVIFACMLGCYFGRNLKTYECVLVGALTGGVLRTIILGHVNIFTFLTPLIIAALVTFADSKFFKHVEKPDE